MPQSEISVGDIVQATAEITEPDFNGVDVWTHARAGGVGHVIDRASGSEPGWWVVQWERSGTIVDVPDSSLRRLGAWDVGRVPA